MNKTLLLSIIVFGSAPFICKAGDVFDSPGPGYRQQIERVFPRRVKDVPADPIIGVVVSSPFPLSQLQYQPFAAANLLDSKNSVPPLSPSITNAFSEPIRFLSR